MHVPRTHFTFVAAQVECVANWDIISSSPRRIIESSVQTASMSTSCLKNLLKMTTRELKSHNKFSDLLSRF